jgi:phosphatidylinositol alpha-mannosyltransferase
MKIAFVFDDTLDNPDGIQQYMSSLAGYYTEQGHEIHYLVGATTRTDIPHVHSLSRNIKVRFNGNRLSIPIGISRKTARKVMREEQFDVIHVQVPFHPLMAGRLITAAPPETVVFGTFHIAPYSKLVSIGNYALGVWSRRLLRRFDEVVSVSPAAQAFCQHAYGVRTEVVPNVFNYDRFAQATPLEKYHDDVLTILYFGRLVERKGSLLLLQAANQLLQSSKAYPAFRVVIAGGGPLEKSLKHYVQQNNLSHIVEFAGRISEDDKPGYYAAADITALPASGGESFGIVLLEGMASGRSAVLGGDNPGYRSVIGIRPELLVDTSSANKLAEKLDWLLTNQAARREVGAWGRDWTKQYDVTIVGQELLTRYESFVKRGH